MARRHHAPVLTASIVIAVALTTVLSACSGGSDPAPSASATSSRSSSPAPSASGGAAAPSATPSDDQTGSSDDGTGPGTGNGSGVDAPTSVDWATVTQQGIAAAGGGAVLSLAGSGDSWTVVVVNGPDGAETQSVVSATLGRVTSGPFPKSVDAATGTADLARATAAKTTASAAATAAERAVPGSTLASLVLGGAAGAPVWTATVTASGATRTVTVDGLTGAATAS
ncbi:hypothetical protein ACLBWP_08145 [Microbacterium sp. M1A1_1b]